MSYLNMRTPQFREPTAEDIKEDGKFLLFYTALSLIFSLVLFVYGNELNNGSIYILSVIGIVTGVMAYKMFKKASKMEKGDKN